MTDKKNEYYRPWLREADDPGAEPPAEDVGLAKPRDVPPIGLDLSRYADEEKLPRAPLIDGEALKAHGVRAGKMLRSGASRFALWTIGLGEKADIPARLDAMEIPRRTKDLAQRSSEAATSATRAAARGTVKASKASAEKSAEVWQKMALGDKVSKLSSEAGRGLSEIADKTKSSISQAAKAGKDSLSETAGKLRPTTPEPTIAPPPPSGLEQLLEREAQSANTSATPTKSAADLPLFSADSKVPEDDSPPPSDVMPPLEEQPDSAKSGASPTANDSLLQPAAMTVAPQPMTTPQPASADTDANANAAPGGAAYSALPIAPPATSGPASDPVTGDEAPQAPEPQETPEKPEIQEPAAAQPRVPPYQIVNSAPPIPSAAARAQGMNDAAANLRWRPSGQTIGLAALALALLLGTSFWIGSRFGGGLSKADVETIVGDYIIANPQVIPAALESQRNREMAQAIDAVRPALEKPYAGAWGGNANGDVTLVVFTDYACGFCRASVPDIDGLIREDKRLKVVYRELPIISRESRNAALMALAAARQGKYDAFHHAMFAQSSLAPSAIIAAAEQAGVSLDGSGDATADEALFQRELESNLALATELQLNATPTWVIGDQLLQGQVGIEALRSAISKARAQKAS
ncbi:MAG TPA: thioredoxin domain-containing protein [Sphingopyxis sp.]|nr:thioredoxin domain-containing protein [Sphingopyxis sp.]